MNESVNSSKIRVLFSTYYYPREMLFPYFWNTKTNISFSICGFDIPKIWQNFKKFLRHQGIHWVKFKVTQNDIQIALSLLIDVKGCLICFYDISHKTLKHIRILDPCQYLVVYVILICMLCIMILSINLELT